METLTYEAVARFGMVSSLLLFIALFVAVIVYVFYFASRERLDEAQRRALDIGQDRRNSGGQA